MLIIRNIAAEIWRVERRVDFVCKRFQINEVILDSVVVGQIEEICLRPICFRRCPPHKCLRYTKKTPKTDVSLL